MNKKKVTFAIVLFIILGLFVFAFANPLNDNDQQLVQSGSGDNNGTPSNNSGSDIISDITNNNDNSVNGRRTRRNNTRNLHNTTTIIDNTVSLIGDISAALNELKNYRSDYVYTDDSKYNESLKEYIDKINNSNSIDDINKNLTDGKDAIDLLIKEDLDAYKKNAKDEIKDYSETLDIRQDLTETLNDYYDQIDEASTKKEIDKLVEEAKKALDEIKTKEISDAKAKAKEEIEEYKKEDEEFISEIEDEKNSIYDNIDEAETLDVIEQVVKDGKESIDSIIDNKTFTVTFITKETKIVRTVKYKESAVEPSSKEFKKTIRYKNVNYKFIDKWDKDFSCVKSALEVRALYRITHVYAKVYLISDDVEIPEDPKTILDSNNYHFFKEIRVAVSDKLVKSAAIDFYNVVYLNEKDIIRDANKYNELPLSEGKYITYKYYVLKFCNDGFHIDGKKFYDFERELADKKEEAIDEINKYNKDDEKYISEITTKKEEVINEINNLNNLSDIDNKVISAKEDIDNIIKNKKFTVTFVSFNNKVTKVDVGYKKDAKAPKIDTNPEDSKIYYEFVKWDKDYKNIKSDLTVTAEYKVTKVIAIVFLLKDGLVIPENPLFTYTVPSAYKRTMEIELKLTDTIINAIKNNKYSAVLASDDDIRSVDKDNKLPKVDKDNKYKTYEFYVMKFCDTTDARFHIDGIINYDKEREALDKAKKELEKLIKQAKEIKTTDKTTASINKLNEDIKKAETNVKGNDITSIKESINDLSNIKLDDIKVTNVYVTNNKESYFDNEDFDLTVTYDDNNGVKGKVVTDYTVTKKDNTPGTHKGTVIYSSVETTFEYTVKQTKVVSIRVVNNQPEYYKNASEDITVTAFYNNGDSNVLPSNKYRLDNFKTSSATKKRTATVVLIDNNNITATFDYSVKKQTLDEYNKSRINKISMKIDVDKQLLVFSNLDSDIEVHSMKKTYLIDDDFVINLTKTESHDVYSVSEKAAGKIHRTNSIIGQSIEVVYVISGKQYTKKYHEIFDIVF